jgi:hypothetical protein
MVIASALSLCGVCTRVLGRDAFGRVRYEKGCGDGLLAAPNCKE